MRVSEPPFSISHESVMLGGAVVERNPKSVWFHVPEGLNSLSDFRLTEGGLPDL